MKKLFVHQISFRIFSPIFSGVIVYLLILLLNNNLQQIQDDFFNQELNFCIVLSYVIQEFSRALLLVFKRLFKVKLSVSHLLLQVLLSLVLCLIITTISINLYFKYILGFEATTEEIYVFNSIFCSITLIYILLYISHQYLYKVNTEKLQQEELIKQNIKADFIQFKKGINSELLFESLESLLILIKTDKEKSDDFIDTLASIYRYVLSGKEKQLVSLKNELTTVNQLIKLLNYFPYREIELVHKINNETMVVPGSLLKIIEVIVKNTIVSKGLKQEINLLEKNDFLEISYIKDDKITSTFTLEKMDEIVNSYKVYSDLEMFIQEDEITRKIQLPKLKIATSK